MILVTCRHQKSLIFLQCVVIFEDFAISRCGAIFVMFLWPLGASWGPLGPLFGGLWPPSGASWGRLGEDLGASLGYLEGFLAAKAPKMPPRAPKTPPGRLPDASRRPPRHPQRPPKGTPETSKRPTKLFQNLPVYFFVDFLCNSSVTCYASTTARRMRAAIE